MATDVALANVAIQETMQPKELNAFITHFDITTIRILQKFYRNGLSFPGDTSCYYVQQLHSKLNREGLKIEIETVRKRLELLVKLKMLDKVDTYPRIYVPVRDVDAVQKVISRVQEILLR